MQNPADMMSAVAASLKERTGRDLDEWVQAVQESGLDPLDQKAVRRWLKSEHGILQNSQWAVADAAARVAGWTPPTLEDHINNQYAGGKVHLRPIFEAVHAQALSLGEDVTVGGRASYIPFVRGKQFAAVAAATRSRVDLGLRFRDVPDSPLLKPSDGPGQSTHKIGLTEPEQVDDHVAALMTLAYEQNA